jgi:hypothetical protein
MSGVTEIYSVRGEAEIRDGALEYSDTITDRAAAEADAAARCMRDATIRKVVYYRVSEDGSFRTLFSYDNPRPQIRTGRNRRAQMADPSPRRRAKPKKRERAPRNLVERLLEALKD